MSQTRGSNARSHYEIRRRYVKRFFARTLLFLAGLFVALLLGEACLRATGFSHFNPYIVDQDVGFSLRPYAAGWWRKEGLTYVTINS